MRQRIGLLFTMFAFLGMGGTTSAGQPPAPTADSFTFLHITEPRQTLNGPNEGLRQLVDTALKMSPRPAFIIATGDITENGRPEEFARFKEAIAPLEAAGIKFYATPGCRDARWSPDAKESFVKAFGKTYQSFDYGGIHFVLLDSTTLLQSWGHLDSAQLGWLERDIKRLKPETPILFFLHHWVGREAAETRPLDNETALYPTMQTRNLLALFTGHGNQDLDWKINGVTTVMTRELGRGSYHRVSVTPLLIHIDRVTEKPSDSVRLATLARERKKPPSVMQSGWDDPDVPFLERRRPATTLRPRAVTDNPDDEKAEYRLSDGPWKPMTKDSRDIWRDMFRTKGIPVGVHTATVRLTTSNDAIYQDELIFEIERDEKEPTRKWAVNLDGPIQSNPRLLGDTLYVSALDGRVYALDTKQGKRRWTFSTKGPFLASPVVEGSALLLGSTDHFFYALESATGKQKWRFDTGSPVYATAAVARGIVCVGGNGKIYGLDANTGKLVWTQTAGGFFQSQAATDGSVFYLGGWDGVLYALDALTGNPKWTVKMGRDAEGLTVPPVPGSPAIASPFVAGGRVYAASSDGALRALDVETGRELWTARAPSGGDAFGTSSPTAVGLNVFIGGTGPRGDVYSLDASTGKILWRVSTGQPIYTSSPKLSPDSSSLAIMGVRGKVSVLESATGKLLWSYELGPGNIFSTPDYDGRTVYTATMANDIQALNAPNSSSSTKK